MRCFETGCRYRQGKSVTERRIPVLPCFFKVTVVPYRHGIPSVYRGIGKHGRKPTKVGYDRNGGPRERKVVCVILISLFNTFIYYTKNSLYYTYNTSVFLLLIYFIFYYISAIISISISL